MSNSQSDTVVDIENSATYGSDRDDGSCGAESYTTSGSGGSCDFEGVGKEVANDEKYFERAPKTTKLSLKKLSKKLPKYIQECEGFAGLLVSNGEKLEVPTDVLSWETSITNEAEFRQLLSAHRYWHCLDINLINLVGNQCLFTNSAKEWVTCDLLVCLQQDFPEFDVSLKEIQRIIQEERRCGRCGFMFEAPKNFPGATFCRVCKVAEDKKNEKKRNTNLNSFNPTDLRGSDYLAVKRGQKTDMARY